MWTNVIRLTKQKLVLGNFISFLTYLAPIHSRNYFHFRSTTLTMYDVIEISFVGKGSPEYDKIGVNIAEYQLRFRLPIHVCSRILHRFEIWTRQLFFCLEQLMYGIGIQTKWWMSLAFHLLITNLLTPIWNLDLLVNLSSTLIIIIFKVLLILLTCVTELCRYFNPVIFVLYSYFIV